MRRIYILLITVLSLICILELALPVIFFNTGEKVAFENDMDMFKGGLKPEYHFAVVAQNTDDPFWQSVKKGTFGAAKELNVAVEFNGPHFTNLEEELQYLNIAIASKVDGIITHVLDEKRFTPLIDKAVRAGIPVITIDSDAVSSTRQSFIGTNSFKLGYEGGKMIAEAAGGKAQVAVILNNYSSDGENVTQNVRLSGFKEAVRSFPGIQIKTVQISQKGIFSAEELTQNILNKYPDLSAIFCTSSKDTLGAAQVVVDFNKVGDITIIGYDDLPEILRYVEKGVVYGTVVGDPVGIGSNSIKAMVELKNKKRTSSYIDTGVYVVTGKSLSDYKRMLEVKKGSGHF